MRFLPLLPLIFGVGLLVGCGNSKDLPMMAGNAEHAASEGEARFLEAKKADDAGKRSKAIKLYDQVASRYGYAPSAAQARFRQAELLEEAGETKKAFNAYQKFIDQFHGSSLYSTVLARQAAMAQAAADGKIRKSFLGLKSKVSVDTAAEMLGKVRDNAPKTRTAAKAQFTIGEIYHADGKWKESVDAYRKLVRDQPEAPEAPEALFRVGEVLTEQADLGNRNQATLNLAEEAFNDYLIQYPNHKRAGEARRNLAALGGRELERTLSTARFYEKSGQYDAAKVYYRNVLKEAKSGPVHDEAQRRLKALGE